VGIVRKLLAIPVILILIFVGIKPFLFALVPHQLFSFMIMSSYGKRYISYGTWDQLKDVVPVLFTSCIAFTALTLLFDQSELDPSFRIILKVISGALFCLAIYYTFRFEAFIKFKGFVMNRKALTS
jgi:hypothetical protein